MPSHLPAQAASALHGSMGLAGDDPSRKAGKDAEALARIMDRKVDAISRFSEERCILAMTRALEL